MLSRHAGLRGLCVKLSGRGVHRLPAESWWGLLFAGVCVLSGGVCGDEYGCGGCDAYAESDNELDIYAAAADYFYG